MTQLTFWGGSLDCQKTLPYGSVEEVVQEVQRHVEVFAPVADTYLRPCTTYKPMFLRRMLSPCTIRL